MNDTTQKTALACTIDGLRLTITSNIGHRLELDANRLTADLLNHAIMHGLKQKLMDAAAISRNPDTGRSASVSDKFDAIMDVYERLLVGEWNKVREGGSPTGGLLLQALMTIYPSKTREQLVAYLAGKSATEKTALRKVPRVATIIEELKAARAKDDGIDGDALLDDLDD